MNSIFLETRLRVTSPTARLALDFQVCSMEFDQVFWIRPGKRVQSVDILGHDGYDFTGLFQSDDGVVNRIRPSRAEQGPRFELVVPMLDASCFRAHEVIVVNRPSSFPDAVWTAKVRNPASGRYAGACKDHDPICFPQKTAQICHNRIHILDGDPTAKIDRRRGACEP